VKYEGFVDWILKGERGVSSNTIATVLTGSNCMSGAKMCHPYDPADFIRCARLLAQVPVFAVRINEMKEVSPQWRALVENWDAIVAAINSDMDTFGNRYPSAYDLMQKILAEAK